MLARAEVCEHAALGHADRLRQRADRQAFDACEAGDVVGPVEDGLAGRGAFGGGGQAGHGVQNSTIVRLILRSEEHTSELQSLMRISYAVFCLKKKKKNNTLLNH